MRDAELLGEIQRQAIVDTGKNFNMICPLAGSTDIGKNWRDTH
jgi:RNA polymerase subunit RPABC4/transcription elongation factor Spt4